MKGLLRCAVFALLLGLPLQAAAERLSAGERARALASGRVDADLLAAFDSGAAQRVLIVYAAEGDARSVGDRILAALPAGDFQPGPRFATTRALAGRLRPRGLSRLLDVPSIVRIGLDRPAVLPMSQSLPLVRLDELHSEGWLGQDGANTPVRVAFIDTGIDTDHPDLDQAVYAEKCFCSNNCCPPGNSPTGNSAEDDQNHGTWVAGVLASEGGNGAAPQGTAPEIELIAVKVIAANGNGVSSDAVLAFEWLRDNHPEVRVINISLGYGLYTGVCDSADASTLALAQPIDDLHDAGVLVVAPSGNNNSTTQILSPACLQNAMAVGAVYDANLGSRGPYPPCVDATTQADQIACWSNSTAQVDLVAPGDRITTTHRGGGTFNLAGTSLASPHVAGCAAVLRGIHPLVGIDHLWAALTTSPTILPDPKTTGPLSFPRLDCAAARHALPVPAVPALSPTTGSLLIALLAGAAGIGLRRRRSTSR